MNSHTVVWLFFKDLWNVAQVFIFADKFKLTSKSVIVDQIQEKCLFLDNNYIFLVNKHKNFTKVMNIYLIM